MKKSFLTFLAIFIIAAASMTGCAWTKREFTNATANVASTIEALDCLNFNLDYFEDLNRDTTKFHWDYENIIAHTDKNWESLIKQYEP